MASNNGGYYDNSHGQAQFRRATGRVASMPNNAAGHPLPQQQQQQPPSQQMQALQYVYVSPSAPPQQQLYSPPPPQYTVEQQMQPAYAPGPGPVMVHGIANSAIPAPHGYHGHQQQLQQMQQPVHQVRPMNGGYAPPHSQVQPPQSLPPAGSYYSGAIVPPGHPGIPVQQQQPQNYAQMQYQGGNPAMQHQQMQRVSDSAGWYNRQYDDGSEESLDLYSHHQRSRQQQQVPKPNPNMSADSAVHSSSYAGTPVSSTETANSTTAHSSLAEDFRRMGISSGQTMPRQQGPPTMSRKNISSEALRKREQQLEDDYDDDDGVAGADIDVTLFPTNSRQMAHIRRSEKYGSPADSAPHTTSSSPAGASPAGKNLESTSTVSNNTAADMPLCTSAAKPAPQQQPHLHFAERQSISPRAFPRHVQAFAVVADAKQQPTMQPVVHSGQRLAKIRNPALAIAGGGPRPNMSRNGSPMGTQLPPSDMASGQRYYGSTGRNGLTGPHSGRPYANDNGFDSSSDRLDNGGNGGRPAVRQYGPPPPQHQHQHQQDPYQQQSMHGAPAPFYSDPRDRNGTLRAASSPYAQQQQQYNGMPPQGHINDSYGGDSNYSRSSSGDALPNPEPGFMPQPGMRPWTKNSSSKSLPLTAGRLGYVPSQVRLGQAYEYGTLGCAVDPRKSIGWYTRAAEKGDPDAELALSGWYLTGANQFLPQNDVEAYLWARRAADRGLEKAEYAVGYYYECGIGVAQPDVHEAQVWYARAARKHNSRAASRLRELKQMGIQAAAASRMSRPRRGKEGSLF
ncbi:hypothetical protein GGI20_003539 [Coemansia sp. BCRC 34301]|nr:hypothetical protein GGI20_003539 [Coemansia sp. BCRC 34301]